MATISTSQDLDSAPRSAGEAFTVNSGAVLTINTDTRWHKNAPSGASWGQGSLGSLTATATTGGTILIDARNVRWVPYTSGAGNVPALGTTITGQTSGVTGELLGVYSSLNVAPTAAGSAMPASGFLKFKTTSGNFNASEALNGIGASTNGATVIGWVEVVMDETMITTVSRTSLFQTRGDWFYLNDTNGTRGQVIQLPNPGGANTHYPGVWIETGVGTDTYEFWPAVQGTTYFGTSHLGTDERSKFVQTIGSGQVRIGNNGTVDVGALPVTGCKVRIPNIFLNSCTTAARTANTVPNATYATRPDFLTTSAGRVDVEYTLGDWYFSFSQPYSVSIKYSATWDQFSITECAISVTLLEFHNGTYVHGDVNAAIFTSNFAGATITDCKWGRSGTIAASDYGTNIQYCYDFVFTNCQFSNRAFRTNAAGYPAAFQYCSGLEFYDCIVIGNGVYFLACLDTYISNLLYCDNFHTTSSGTTPGLGAVYIGAGCVDAKVVGGGWWPSTLSNMHQDACYLYCLGATSVRWQECGTRTSPISGGTSNAMLYAFNDGGNNQWIEIKRAYFNNIATRLLNGINSTEGMLVENCAGDYADALGTSGTAGFVFLKGYIKGLAAASQYTAFTSVYGTIFYSIYTSTTAGRLGLAFNEATADQASYVQTSFSGASGFTSTGTLSLQVLNDYIVYEYPYWIKGIDSFQNAAVVLSGTNTGNHTVEYQIDTGGGYSAWKAATGANLSGESFTASGGFRLKVRITCNTASTTNALTGLYFLTYANTAAQDVQYPLDVVTVKLTAKDAATGSNVEGARAVVYATTGTSVTITRTGSTAYVAHTNHGYTTGQKVVILGAEQGEYNGIKVITVTGVNEYTFTVSGTPATPATGTITSHRGIIDGTSDSSGVVEENAFEYVSDLSITGRIRRGSASPYYKTSPVSGVIESDGFETIVFMVSDS